MAERPPCKRQVAGSIPAGGSVSSRGDDPPEPPDVGGLRPPRPPRAEVGEKRLAPYRAAFVLLKLSRDVSPCPHGLVCLGRTLSMTLSVMVEIACLVTGAPYTSVNNDGGHSAWSARLRTTRHDRYPGSDRARRTDVRRKSRHADTRARTVGERLHADRRSLPRGLRDRTISSFCGDSVLRT